MALVSSLNNFSSQALGIFNLQAKYRLINTGVWGLCFMSAFVWGFFSSMRMESGLESIVLRFPTVCIVGFIPHLLILVGIVVCTSIYFLAFLLCFFLPPADGPQPRSLADRFRLAHENMQANAQLSNFHLDWHEDFYTALLKIGFTALTVASEAVWLNEGERVTVSPLTWLEEEKIEDMEAFRQANSPLRQLGVHWNGNETGESPHTRSRRPWKSGYSKEIRPRAIRTSRHFPHPRAGTDGVGHMQRYGRYLGVGTLFHNIFWLCVSWVRLFTNKMLDKFGIEWRPQWLKLQKQREMIRDKPQDSEQTPLQGLQPFWILSDKGILELPKSDDFDAAKEIERRHRSETNSDNWGQEQEEALESAYYDWFKHGEWGSKDESGSYQPGIRDDDATSVISTSETDSESELEDTMDMGSGASTPTQTRPYTWVDDRSPSPSPGPSSYYPSIPLDPHPLDPHHLASLLDPKSPEERSTARIHAQHLSSSKIITRSQYRNAQTIAAIKLLTSTRYRPPNSNIPTTGPLTRAEEEQLLEQLILTRRSKPLPPGRESWRDGAAGMGQGGPQCVVCQSAPRTIMAFPCRCLSICEECRVSLAMNNFATCVCCRQAVANFSRLFVP